MLETGERIEVSEGEWKQFVEKYFNDNKNRITGFIHWLLGKGYYRQQLEQHNSNADNITEDILQNIFVELLDYSPQRRATLVVSKDTAVFNNLVKWAVEKYFKRRQSAGSEGRGEYGRLEDAYVNRDTKLVGLFDPEGQGAEEAFKLQNRRSAPLLSNEQNPYILEEKEELSRVVEEILGDFRDPRLAKIIKMRFGLPPYEKEFTLDEVGDRFGVTRERIRQIEAKIMRKLREPKRANKLRTFLE